MVKDYQEGMKLCRCCDRVLRVEFFSIRRYPSGKTGWQHTCKDCTRARNTASVALKRARIRAEKAMPYVRQPLRLPPAITMGAVGAEVVAL